MGTGSILAIVGVFLGLMALVRWVAPLTTINATAAAQFKWNASQTLANAAANDQGMILQDGVTKTSNYNQAAGAGANAVNQGMRRIYSIAGGANLTIDLSAAFVNLANNPTATFARIKGFLIRVLSAADDSVNGTAAVSILCGNAGGNDWVVQGNATGLAGATSQYQVKNGAWFGFASDDATGTPVDATHKLLKIVNNDGAVAVAVQITALGADS